MKVTALHDKIRYYTDILSEDEINQVKDIVANIDNWEKIFDDGHHYDPNSNYDDNGHQSVMLMLRVIVADPKFDQLRKIINGAYKKAHASYVEEFNIHGDNPITPFGAIDKHMVGTAYATHIDSAPIGVESYTMLMYLNDDYIGGELSFSLPRPDYKFFVRNGILENGPRSNRRPDDPINKGLIDFVVKPEAFSILIFPPLFPYAHTVHTITEGYKLIIKGHWQVNKTDVSQWSANPYEGFSDEDIAAKQDDMKTRHNHMYAAIAENKDLVPEDLKTFYL